MRIMKYARWMMVALMLPLVAATAHAGVFISVGVAPPMLPVYEQPPCPEPGLMWMPGYWAYDYDAQSYYWVPGAWVPAPFQGALWTPPYWGWSSGNYMFHSGYWGHEVGYYGGVNYGFGYFGLGFVGGRWHENRFEYNEAVVHVNRTVIHETYIDRTVIHEHEIDRDRRVAYSGGPGGVHHEPTQEERRAMQSQHVPPTHFQQEHMQQARTDRGNLFKVNHGHPQNVALTRPLPAQHVTPPPAMRGGAQGNNDQRGAFHNNNVPAMNGNRDAGNRDLRGGQQQRGPQQQRGIVDNPGQNNNHAQGNARPAQPGMVGVPAQPGRSVEPVHPTPNQPYRQGTQEPGRPQPLARPAPQQQYHPAPQNEPQHRQAPMPQSRPEPQYRPAPQNEHRQAPEPQNRPAQQPQSQYRPAPQQSRPEPQYRPAPQAQYHPAPQQQLHPAPAARPEHESRPAPAQRPEHDSRPERERR